MTVQKESEVEHSPLDQIRQVEAEVAKAIAAARQRADTTTKDWRARADDLENEAREDARREGEQHYQEIIAEAKTAAERLLEQAHAQAEELRQTGKSHIDAAVRFVEDTVVSSHQEAADA